MLYEATLAVAMETGSGEGGEGEGGGRGEVERGEERGEREGKREPALLLLHTSCAVHQNSPPTNGMPPFHISLVPHCPC